MSESVDVKQALSVFHKIVSEGVAREGCYTLNGLQASQGFDGYTASIFNDYVRLDLFFHNKFALDASNSKERRLFLEKIDRMAKEKR